MYIVVYIAGLVSGVVLLCMAIGAGFNGKEDRRYDKADNN